MYPIWPSIFLATQNCTIKSLFLLHVSVCNKHMLLCLLFYISCLSIFSKALYVNFFHITKIVLYIILHIRNHNFCISYFKCHLKITILYWIWGFFFPKVLIYFMFPRKSKSKTHSHNMLELNVYIRWEILCKFNLSFFSHMIAITFYLNKMKNPDSLPKLK